MSDNFKESKININRAEKDPITVTFKEKEIFKIKFNCITHTTKIEIAPDTSFDDLTDVTLSGVDDNHITYYDFSQSKWVNISFATFLESFVDTAQIIMSGGKISLNQAAIDHDELLNFTQTEHRIINNDGTSTTELWSASKINSELTNKAASSHEHLEAGITDLDKYTQSEVDTLIDGIGGALAGLSDVDLTDIGDGKILKYNSATEMWECEEDSGGEGGEGVWGSITGTLSDQNDLQSALDAKAGTSHTHDEEDITDLVHLQLGETDSTAYRGDRGKIGYDHSQLTSANPHAIDITDLSSYAHNSLQSLNSGNYLHLTAAEYAELHVAVTVVGAPLTLSTQEITFNYDSNHFGLNGNDLQIKANGIDTTLIDWGTGAGQVSSEDIPVDVLGAPAFTQVQQMLSIFGGAGLIIGGVLSDGGSQIVNYTEIQGTIRVSDDHEANVKPFVISADSTAVIPTNTIRYIGVETFEGTPRVVVRTSYNWDSHTEFALGTVINELDTLHILNNPQAITNGTVHSFQRFYETMPFQRADRRGGLILGETGNRYITITGGVIYDGYNKIIINAVNTTPVGDTFDSYSSAGRESTGNTQWDNDNFDNSGSLESLGNNKYANLWFYLESDNDVVCVYGTAQYISLAGAESETAPTVLPDRINAQGKFIGRILFQKGDSTAQEIQSIFTTVLNATLASNHNNLAGLQAGTIGEYYHLTSAEHTELTQWLDDVTLGNDGRLTLVSGTDINEFSTDGTLGGDSDDAVPTEKAVKTYVDAAGGGGGLWSRADTTLSPDTANDSVDIGSGDFLTAGKFQLRDAQIYISSINDGYLDLIADIGIRLNADVEGTGNFNIIKVDPEIRLTDTGDSEYTRITRSDTDAKAIRYNRVHKPGGVISNLVTQWKCNDNEADTIVIDSSGNGHDGTASVNTNVLNAAGKINDAFAFSTERYFSKTEQIVSDYPFTITTWIKFNSGETGVPFGMVKSSVDNVMYGINLAAGQIALFARNTDWKSIQTGAGFDDNQWHFVVASFETDTSKKLYVDDTYIDELTDEVTFNVDINMWSVGALLDDTPSYLVGDVDDVRIYDKVLSENERIALFNSGDGTEVNDIAGGDTEVTIWQSQDGVNSHEEGIITIGDPDGRTVIEGKTIRFNIGGVEQFQIDADGNVDIGSGNYLTTGSIGIGAASPVGSFQISDKMVVCKVFTDEGINAAIDALGSEGGVVILPEGIYIINATITFDYANTVLQGTGRGTILDASADQSNDVINVNGKDFCEISNMTIIGEAGGGHSTRLILNNGGDDFTAKDLHLQNSDHIGMYLLNGNRVNLTRIYVENSDNVGIQLSSCSYGHLTDITGSSNGSAVVLFDTGCQFNSLNGLTSNGDAYGILCKGNYITMNAVSVSNASTCGITIDTHDRNTVSNFASNACRNSIRIYGSDYTTLTNLTMVGSTDNALLLDNNSHYNTITNISISYTANNKADIKVTGTFNSFTTFTLDGIAGAHSEYGFELVNADYTTIKNGVCNSHGTAGILLDASSTNNHIDVNLEGEGTSFINNGSNNTIINSVAGMTTHSGGLTVEGSFFPKQVNDSGMSGTDGGEGEIVYNQDDNTFYGCIVTGTPATWAALH